MKDIGKLTAGEIAILKQKHGEIHEVKSVKDGATHFSYVKKPDINIISATASDIESDPIGSLVVMFNSTWIGGSDAVKSDDEMKLGVAKYVSVLFKIVEAEGKKL